MLSYHGVLPNRRQTQLAVEQQQRYMVATASRQHPVPLLPMPDVRTRYPTDRPAFHRWGPLHAQIRRRLRAATFSSGLRTVRSLLIRMVPTSVVVFVIQDGALQGCGVAARALLEECATGRGQGREGPYDATSSPNAESLSSVS